VGGNFTLTPALSRRERAGVRVSSKLVRLSGNDLILDFFAQASEVSVVTGDAHEQVAIFIRVLLGGTQGA
jgi:hypothetical protein